MINSVIMHGGDSSIKKAIKTGKFSGTIIAVLVIIYALKAAVVMYTYNNIAPKLISNLGQTTDEFRPLSYSEALLFTILANVLFC